MKILFLFLPALCLVCCNTPSNTYNILHYGASTDNDFVNTFAINNAIQACYADGGGTVYVPPGIYQTGTIVLLSNVSLYLEAGATLLGSTDTVDYKPMNNALFHEGYNRYGIIYAADARNISIIGPGEINGNGTFFMNGIDKPHMGHDWDRQYTRQGEAYMKEGTVFEDGPVSYSFRPGMMLTIERCENIKILDVRLNNTPEWTVRMQDCDNAEFSGVTIHTDRLIPNSDGIHVTSSRNVKISDCEIFSGDDAIIVTGFGDGLMPGDKVSADYIGNKTGYAENVVVSNCILSSRSACIRVGYGRHPIRNLVFSNIVMETSNRGIGVFARDESSIENVLFENITMSTRLHSGHWWGKGEPIHISAVKDSEQGNAGTINNIRFSNIMATSETGMLIYGSEGSPIKNISLQNVSLTIHKGKYSEMYGGNFDLRPAATKDRALFKHDIPGLFATYVDNLSLTGLTINWDDDLPAFFTHGLEVTHFNGLRIDNFKGRPAFEDGHLSAIRISDGSGVEMNVDKDISIAKQNVKD